MVALKLIEYTVLGAVFLAIVGGLIYTHLPGISKTHFFAQIDSLAQRVDSLIEEGSVQYFELSVPDGGWVSFEEHAIEAGANGENHRVEVQNSLSHLSLGPGDYTLILTRTSGGVEIAVG